MSFLKSSFAGVVGCIDGTHIRIIKPKHHGNSYINRKQYPSVVLQGVCDHELLFLDVYAGETGSVHNARVFQKSDLFTPIANGTIQFPHGSHLLDDLAYRLSTYLLVGFKNAGQLTPQQQNFNHKLSQLRASIENAFGLLKGRFRRLKFVETVRLDLIVLLTITACILHNECILEGDYAEDNKY